MSAGRQRAALQKARERRIQVEVERVARERLADEATAAVLVRQQELADAEAAAEDARARLGVALQDLVAQTDLERAGSLGGLMPAQVRRLIRLAATTHAASPPPRAPGPPSRSPVPRPGATPAG